MPAAKPALAEVVVSFVLGAALVGGAAAVADAVGHTHFSLPVRLLVPLVAGLGAIGLVAVVRDRDWFTHTPVYRHWTGLLGRTGGRFALIGVFVLWLAAAGLLALYPVWWPSPLVLPMDPPDPVRQEPPEAKASDPEFLAAAVRDLRSADRDTVHQALHRLGDARDIGRRPDDLRAELFRLLDGKQVNPSDVFRAFERWGTLADVPRLEAVPAENASDRRGRLTVRAIRLRELGPGRYGLAGLRSGDPDRVRDGLNTLESTTAEQVTDRPPELGAELLRVLRSKESDRFDRDAAARALGLWAGPADLPAMEAAHAELTAARLGDLADRLAESVQQVKTRTGR